MAKSFENLIKNTKTLSIIDLKKEADALYNARIAREENLLAADKEGKLKSKALKDEVKHIKASRATEKKKVPHGDGK